MYQFNKHQDEDGIWRFELGGISLLIDGFSIKDEKHWIHNPAKAIAFFNVNGYVYGISNELKNLKTAEDFYDTMAQQYSIMLSGSKEKRQRPNSSPGQQSMYS